MQTSTSVFRNRHIFDLLYKIVNRDNNYYNLETLIVVILYKMPTFMKVIVNSLGLRYILISR